MQTTFTLAQLLDPLCELGPAADVEIELAASGPERLVHVREHPAQPVRDVMLTTAPPPPSRINGAAACVHRNGPVRLTASTRDQSS